MNTIGREIRNHDGQRRSHRQGAPIFVIGGPPGGGKTAVLKQLLAHEVARGRRPAVLMNELGEANVNALLLDDGSASDRGFDLHVIRSSCTCCDLRPALGDLLRRVLRSARGAVFIQAAGLPPLRQLAEMVEAVVGAGRVSVVAHPASVIAVLDAGVLAASRVLARVHREDIATADAVVLNKVDLVGDGDLDHLVARVCSVKAGVRLFTATHGRVPSARLLRVRPASPRSAGTQPASSSSSSNSLVSATAQLLGPVVVPRLQRLLARCRRDLVRVKGFMHTKGAPGLHELQWVPDTLEVRPRRAPLGVRAELVIVGHRQLDWERLATELDRCIEVEPIEAPTEAAL